MVCKHDCICSIYWFCKVKSVLLVVLFRVKCIVKQGMHVWIFKWYICVFSGYVLVCVFHVLKSLVHVKCLRCNFWVRSWHGFARVKLSDSSTGSIWSVCCCWPIVICFSVCLSICVAEGTVHCVLLSWCYGWKSNTAVITETHTPPLTHNTVTVISSLDDYVSVFAVVKHKDLGTIV